MSHLLKITTRCFSLILAGGSVLLCTSPSSGVTADQADQAFGALNKVYWQPAALSFRKEETGVKKPDFWLAAQLWDTVMDDYDRTGDPMVRRQIDQLFDTFMQQYPDWTKNKYNDDIMWWSIACARAYTITHDDRYLKKSRSSFDFVYDHFLDDTFGGGLYWTSDRKSKNSCINSPAVIAAGRLSALLHDPSYLQKAKSLYQWQKKMLTDGHGKVFDNISFDPHQQHDRVQRFSFTYNQGTFLGAGVVLFQQTKNTEYLNDAIQTAQWTRANLCVTDQKILKDEGQGDGGAFKGIFTRYMKLLVGETKRPDLLAWMRTNADTAWRNRRMSDNIIGNDWTTAPTQPVQSQTAASAVAVIVEFADKR